MSIAVALILTLPLLQGLAIESLPTANTSLATGKGSGWDGGLSMSLYNPFGGIPLWPETIEVKIKNQLESKVALVVYCKDESSVGMQEIGYDSTLAFSFTQPVAAVFLKNMVYTCEFKWNNQVRNFDLYKQKRDSTNCKTQCDWEIKEKGPCLAHSSCYPWN